MRTTERRASDSARNGRRQRWSGTLVVSSLQKGLPHRAAMLAARLLSLATDRGRAGGWPRRALAVAAVVDEFGYELRLVRPIPQWQRALAALVAPLARRLGYAEGARALRAMCDVGHQLELTAEWAVPSARAA